MEIIPEQYVCDICGRISTNKNQIIECENRGKPVPLVREGDIIYFKDCQETPIYYKYVNDKNSVMINYPNYMSYFYEEDYDLYRHISKSYLVGHVLRAWFIYKIEIIGHGVNYYLGTQSTGGSFTYGYNNYFDPEWVYPVIESNEMMLKILNLYNKR